MKRISSIDIARGLVIVIMALDHTRDLLHTTSLTQNPVNLDTTTGPLFLTRWITHLCAPTFVFLAGTSAYFTKKSQGESSRTRRFLLTRGLWLIFLELTLVNFGLWADLLFRTFFLEVIYTIGMGFIILSLLLKLPAKALGAIGLAIILFHNLLPPIQSANPIISTLSALFLNPGVLPLGGGRTLATGYPAIPWLGIMLFGYSFGQLFEKPAAQRRKILLLSGVTALTLFMLLRSFNYYGDPAPWTVRSSTVATILSFINVTKYPPSLLFTSVMLGIMFFVLAVADQASNRVTRFLSVYGRVPFFFFLLHFYVIHVSMFVIILLQGTTWNDMQFGNFNFGRPVTGVELELPYIYLYWVCLILLFYPLCRWYGRYKSSHPEKKWLSYL